MELTGHAHDFHAQIPGIGCGHGEMIVTPAAGGQRFQLQMGIHMRQIPTANDDVTAIVEYRKTRLYAVDGLTYSLGIVCVNTLSQINNITAVFRTLALC